MNTKLYFAYGSNLNPEQMNKRCPSNTFKSVALLPGFRVAFTRYSEGRKGGVADVVEDDSSPGVWGVVYEITEEDLERLDACGGYRGKDKRNIYERYGSLVLIDGDEGQTLGVLLYSVASKSNEEYLPNNEYMNQIITGAEHWGLPEEYTGMLKGLPVRGQ